MSQIRSKVQKYMLVKGKKYIYIYIYVVILCLCLCLSVCLQDHRLHLLLGW